MAAAEQRKATTAGDSPAPVSAPEPAPKAGRVKLALSHPHTLFDLSALDLPSLTQDGTVYTSDQADTVLMLAHKYDVPVTVVPAEEEK